MTGSNPVDRSKIGTKRHGLTDKKGLPLSVIITSASTHDIKAVTDVIEGTVIKRLVLLSTTKGGRRRRQYLCLDRAYNSKLVRQAMINHGYVPNIPYKKRRGQHHQKKERICQKQHKSSTRDKR